MMFIRNEEAVSDRLELEFSESTLDWSSCTPVAET